MSNRWGKNVRFESSSQYWEERYRTGGNSGAGSYDRLARFKADFLNRFVGEHEIYSVLELGSGDGAQLELADYPSYIGVDVSPTAVQIARQKFAERRDVTILHSSELREDHRAQLVLSLDVIYHLVEDNVFAEYMENLFDRSLRWVVIYASNRDEIAGSKHVRHRRFTDWVSRNRDDFEFIEHVPNKYPFDENSPDDTSYSDFYVFRRLAWS